MFVRQLMRLLFRPDRARLNHGGRLINPYDLQHASDEEKLLILGGIARSPDDAEFLLKRHRTASAKQIFRRVPRHKRRRTWRDRLLTLIQRIDGHDPRDVYGGRKYDAPRVRIDYRYRVKK